MTVDALRVRDLRVRYHTPRGTVKAVEEVSFSLRQGEKLGLVGESGSGKSTIALALMRLIREPGRIESGQILLGDSNLLALSDEQMRLTRFARISLVPQGAMNSLNPVMRIKHQLGDTIRAHDARIDGQDVETRIAELMEWVGLRKNVANMVARALLLKPRIIVADEPVSMVDASLRATILESLLKLYTDLGISLVYITHDLTTAYQLSGNIITLYQGAVAEVGDVERVIKAPQHPYTRLLVGSIPVPNPKLRRAKLDVSQDEPVAGDRGCHFASRCPHVTAECRESAPPLYRTEPNHATACYLYKAAPAIHSTEIATLLQQAKTT